jgi:chromosome segregation ATPase
MGLPVLQEMSKLQESQETLTKQLRETQTKLNESEQSLHNASMARDTLTNALEALRKNYNQKTEQLVEVTSTVQLLQQEKAQLVGQMRHVEDSAKAQSYELERLKSVSTTVLTTLQYNISWWRVISALWGCTA